MSYCIKCGHKNESSVKFCINCGTRLVSPLADNGAVYPTIPRAPIATQGGTKGTATADFNLGPWIAKNRKILLSATGIIIVIWAINYFFFKAHPDKDGKALAVAECACEEKRIGDFENRQKEFLQNYDTYHFTNVYQAGQKLDSIRAVVLEDYKNCMQQAVLLRDQKSVKYAADRNSLEVFHSQYSMQKQLCQVKNEDISKTAEEIRNKLLNFTPYVAPSASQPPPIALNEPAKEDTVETTNPVQQPEPSNGVLTDEFARNKISDLYNNENSIGSSPGDINKLLDFYEFPLDRYYDAKNVDADRLLKIYSDSYLGSLSFHQVKDFENKMTISRQTDGSVKIIVRCVFEFSTRQSPAEKRSRNVVNVYVISTNGKIKSVYQLL